jgi:hypothetical protein
MSLWLISLRIVADASSEVDSDEPPGRRDGARGAGKSRQARLARHRWRYSREEETGLPRALPVPLNQGRHQANDIAAYRSDSRSSGCTAPAPCRTTAFYATAHNGDQVDLPEGRFAPLRGRSPRWRQHVKVHAVSAWRGGWCDLNPTTPAAIMTS